MLDCMAKLRLVVYLYAHEAEKVIKLAKEKKYKNPHRWAAAVIRRGLK